MITAFSTVPVNAPAPERELPQYAGFNEPKTILTEPQRQTLLAVKGVMTSAEVAEASGIDRRKVTGFLSTLCTKGLLERAGFEGVSVKWRTTRKGRKWQDKS